MREILHRLAPFQDDVKDFWSSENLKGLHQGGLAKCQLLSAKG
jgi:hypothetical protein